MDKLAFSCGGGACGLDIFVEIEPPSRVGELFLSMQTPEIRLIGEPSVGQPPLG